MYINNSNAHRHFGQRNLADHVVLMLQYVSKMLASVKQNVT